MKINELYSLNKEKTYFKLSTNSITVKDETNKIKGVINDISQVSSLPFGKQVDLNVKFKGKLNIRDHNLYIGQDNTLYYFIDQKWHETVCKLNLDGFPDDFNAFQEKINNLQIHNINIIFMNIL